MSKNSESKKLWTIYFDYFAIPVFMYMLYSSYREGSFMWIAWALLLAATLKNIYRKIR